MAPTSHICQSPYVNHPADPAKELEVRAGQGTAGGSNAKSDEVSTEALTPPEAPTPPFIPPISGDLFTKFMKVIMETSQARDQFEPRERPLKARTPEIYSGKSHMHCYHIYQQCEDYFKTSVATRMNCTLFAATFFCGSISFR